MVSEEIKGPSAANLFARAEQPVNMPVKEVADLASSKS
jgi:hypothetical protein